MPWKKNTLQILLLILKTAAWLFVGAVILFLLFFPSIWNDFNLLISNFFILLALRRLLSMHSAKAPKEKIFDASLWIFFASFFHFWSILFILLQKYYSPKI